MSLNSLESITTYQLTEMIRSTLTLDHLEYITTDALAKMSNSIAPLLRRLPNIPLGELNRLVDKLAQSNSESQTDLKPYEVYKGIPVHLYQEENPDEWRASVKWYGHLGNVDLEEREKPTGKCPEE